MRDNFWLKEDIALICQKGNVKQKSERCDPMAFETFVIIGKKYQDVCVCAAAENKINLENFVKLESRHGPKYK